MLAGVLSALPRSRARHLLDQGFWLSGREGDVLTRAEAAVTHLFYLSSGEARVMSPGKRLGTCPAGALIGDVTVLSVDEATATVILEGHLCSCCAPLKALSPLLPSHPTRRHNTQRV